MAQNQSVVWITGASSGIGKALADHYSSKGWYVVLSARSKDTLLSVQAGLRHRGDSVVVPVDVTDIEQIHRAARLIREDIGRLDLIINSAGISQRSKILETDRSVYRKLMDVNYLGSVDATVAVLPLLMESKGHVVVMSSIAGKIGAPLRSGYAASKHALHGFFDCLRSEVHSAEVGVTIVCAGYVRTDVDLHALGKDGKPTGKQDADNRNGMYPEDLARKIYNAVKRGKREVYFGGTEVVAVYLKRFFPNLLARILARKS